MINLKDNIFIEEFDDEFSMWKFWNANKFKLFDIVGELYLGKTSEIPEDIARISTNSYYLGSNFYGDFENCEFSNEINKLLFFTAKESIYSICTKPFCIIYKAK